MVLATLVNFRPSANGNTEFLGGAEFFFFFFGGGGGVLRTTAITTVVKQLGICIVYVHLRVDALAG